MAAVTTWAFVMRVIWAIIRKDLLIEWRAQARIVSLSAFIVLVLSFCFRCGSTQSHSRRHASGLSGCVFVYLIGSAVHVN